MNKPTTKDIIEAVLMAAGKPLSVDQVLAVFLDDEKPSREVARQTIEQLQEDYQERGIELVRIASGYRIQVKQDMEPWVSRLIDEKPTRYSRALLETLSLVAYRQPITRGEIEDIRGVSVSTSIMKTLQERDWVRIVGHRDVPGKPAMFGTTRQFLDYFNLKSLDELPSLMELKDLDSLSTELELALPDALEDQAEAANEDVSQAEGENTEETTVQLETDPPENPEVLH
jgi:segregation and condensation protein B